VRRRLRGRGARERHSAGERDCGEPGHGRTS
jgi:hypothetical protein